jgi:hypothetical protein
MHPKALNKGLSQITTYLETKSTNKSLGFILPQRELLCHNPSMLIMGIGV